MVQHLLQRRADPHAKDASGWTPLHVATFIGDTASARMLLEAGADPQARTHLGETPLQVIETGCWRGHGAQNMCAQHGGVVKILTRLSTTNSTDTVGTPGSAGLGVSAPGDKKEGCIIA